MAEGGGEGAPCPGSCSSSPSQHGCPRHSRQHHCPGMALNTSQMEYSALNSHPGFSRRDLCCTRSWGGISLGPSAPAQQIKHQNLYKMDFWEQLGPGTRVLPAPCIQVFPTFHSETLENSLDSSTFGSKRSGQESSPALNVTSREPPVPPSAQLEPRRAQREGWAPSHPPPSNSHTPAPGTRHPKASPGFMAGGMSGAGGRSPALFLLLS